MRTYRLVTYQHADGRYTVKTLHSKDCFHANKRGSQQAEDVDADAAVEHLMNVRRFEHPLLGESEYRVCNVCGLGL